MNTLLNQIHDFLALEVVGAKQSRLDEIKISISRAKAICNSIRVARHHARMTCGIVKQ
jgi:hypothetical protein